MKKCILHIAAFLVVGAIHLHAATNRWTDGTGKWEIGANWSLGIAPDSNQVVLVTNTVTKTVTIDASTVASNSGSAMTVSNLTVSGPLNTTNTLFLNNAGTNTPLRMLNGMTLDTNGVMVVTNSAVRVEGAAFNIDGSVTNLGGGQIVVTDDMRIGNAGRGDFTTLGGLVFATNCFVGYLDGSQGTLTIAGGTNQFNLTFGLDIGYSANATGAVWVMGGQLVETNNQINIGVAGIGQMTVSNGTVVNYPYATLVGLNGEGTLTVAGGTISSGGFLIAFGTSSTGAVWFTGGQLLPTNNAISVGEEGVGQMTVSNGTVNSYFGIVGDQPGSQGTLTLAGGTVNFNLLSVGSSTPTATGAVWVTGGQLSVIGVIPGLRVGAGGVGQMTVSNGTVQSLNLDVGESSGSLGTLTLAGGTNTFTGLMQVGVQANATGTVWLTGGQLVVTNDYIAVGVAGVGKMTVSNGTLLARSVVVSTNGAVQSVFSVAGGTVVIGGQAVTNGFRIGDTAGTTGSVQVSSGQLVVTNTSTIVGNLGVGTMTVSNGTFLASTIQLGSSAGGRGDLTLADGGLVQSAGINPILICNDFGQVGGNLSWTNIGSAMYCGYSHPGAYALSNGTSSCQDVYVGYDNAGTMTIAGGAMSILSRLTVGHLGSPMSTGAVWVTGGQLTMLGLPAIIGNSGVGQMTISNGTVSAGAVIVGNGGYPATLAVAGGTVNTYSNLTLGDCGGAMTGIVTITGGNLFVTNAAHNAVLDVRDGSFIVSSGLVMVDKLVVTSACARVVHTGGALIYSQLVLDPNQSTAGDGIPNGWKQQYVLDPFDPNVGNEGADGTGMNNLQKYLAGFNPTNPVAYPHIISLARQGANMNVAYRGANGDSTYVPGIAYRTNVLEFTTGTANGSYSPNNFASTGQTNILGSGTGLGVVTNMVDSGGATNTPARYYRVRVLVP